MSDCDIECVVLKPSIEQLASNKLKRFEEQPSGLGYVTLSFNAFKEIAENELEILEIPTSDEGFSSIEIIEY